MRNEILNDFCAYGRGPLAVLDDFYDITDPAMHTERQHEIYQWLMTKQQVQENDRGIRKNDTSQEIAAWICLDDEELLQGPSNA